MCINKFKIAIVMILFVFIINISMPVQASLIDEIWSSGKDFIEMGKNSGGAFDGQKMQTTVNDLYNLFLIAGIVIAVIIGAFLGIKFMTESIEGKAKIKEALIPFCVGCVIIFGGFAIWKVAMGLFGEVEEIESSAVSQQQYIHSNCEVGKHAYDNFADKDCNNSNCNMICNHNMGSTLTTDGMLICQNKDCGLKTTYCGSTYSNREKEDCNYDGGICQKCGYKCPHRWKDVGNIGNHQCEMCLAWEKHTFTGQACSKCGNSHIHKYSKNLQGYIVCSVSGCTLDKYTSCEQQNLEHSWEDYYSGQICSKCKYPNPDKQPIYPEI